MKRINCDIAIIGGGPAGLAAAIEAASAGCDVAVFERSGKVGGARDGGCGFFGVESSIQKAEGNPLTKKQALDFMMEHSHWKTNARLVTEYISFSASTVDWMKEVGLPLTHTSAYYPGAAATIHNYADFRRIKITDLMLKKALELGVKIYYNHSVTKLKMSGGAVAGYEGVTADDMPFEGIAKAMVSAGGGFAGDPEMVREAGYTVDEDLMYTFDLSPMNGDSLRMMWEAGAAKGPMMMDTYMGLTKGYGGPMGTAPLLSALRQPVNIMVNQKGYRFLREDLVSNPGYAGCAIHSQYKGCGIMILDENIYKNPPREERGAFAPPPPDAAPPSDSAPPEAGGDPFDRFTGTMVEIMEEAIAEGCKDFYIADSLEDLACQADIPFKNLKETLDEYNLGCEKGEDSLFYKDEKHLVKITGPRYYAARFFCDTYGGLGGVKIDHKARVLDEREDPIPGLFAAGNDANTIFGECYPFFMAGNTSGFALNTGRMAGLAASGYCKV